MMKKTENIVGRHWREIICRGIESDTLDYKAALDWKTLPRRGKAKFVRHCIALANTRGGMVVVGVSEDEAGRPVIRTGLTPAQAAGFDPSTVGAFINSCADPPIDMTVHRPEVDGKIFAVIEVRPFAVLPHVCTKGIADELNAGVFYIRTADASSRPACRAGEVHALLIRALRRQREELGRMLRGLLWERRDGDSRSAEDRFEEQMLHGRGFFRRKMPADSRKLFVEVAVRPDSCREDRFPRRTLREMSSILPSAAQWYPVNTAIRHLDTAVPVYEELTCSGLYYFIAGVSGEKAAAKAIAEGISRGIVLLKDCDGPLGVTVRLLPGGRDEEQPVRLGGKYAKPENLTVTRWDSPVNWLADPVRAAGEITHALMEEFAPRPRSGPDGD